jgi:hypothetical protein
MLPLLLEPSLLLLLLLLLSESLLDRLLLSSSSSSSLEALPLLLLLLLAAAPRSEPTEGTGQQPIGLSTATDAQRGQAAGMPEGDPTIACANCNAVAWTCWLPHISAVHQPVHLQKCVDAST